MDIYNNLTRGGMALEIVHFYHVGFIFNLTLNVSLYF